MIPPGTLNLQGRERAVQLRLARLQAEGFLERLWRCDASLWKSEPGHQAVIRNRLGWLAVVEPMRAQVPRLQALAESLRKESTRDVVVLGMGGSSLCPEVIRLSFGAREGWPRLSVLDSTDPGTILSVDRQLDPKRTFFIVSSKSGGTIESVCLHRFFAERARRAGIGAPGRHFAAITDPGTPLADLARREGFREVFLNPADIGGRYSALSLFGLVPATLAGVNVEALLDRAGRMAASSAAGRTAAESPGVVLGAVLGEMALGGRDKVTLLASPPFESFGLWAEQLLAESTGKEGRGLTPVAGEPIGEPDGYGEDRIFVALLLPGREGEVEAGILKLEAAGHPVMKLVVTDPLDLGGEFYRWEVATAVAGSILGIDPFDEPNVQESKDNTRALLEEYRQSGSLPAGSGPATPLEGPRDLMKRVRPGDYFALLAYVTPTESNHRLLDRIRTSVRDRLRVATTLGYGPRYLHSTGQLHKGGPDRGVFLLVTAEDEALPIPGESYDFSILKRAQALGDLRSLQRHGRRVAHVHLEKRTRGLEELVELVEQALEPLQRQ